MSAVRLSAADWCFLRDGTDPAAYYARLAELGVDAVEMVAPERRAAARDAGLAVLNTAAPGMEQGVNRPEHHDELLPRIRDAIADAGENGIPQVIVFSGNRDGQPDEVGVRHCRDAFGALLPDAEAAGVTLIFEMLSSTDHVDYQADRSAYGFALARELDHPRFRVLYDVYHMVKMGEDPAVRIPDDLAWVAHLHAAQTPDRTAPRATGGIDYGVLVRSAAAAGYTGYWGLEFVVPEGDPLDALAGAVQLFRSFEIS